ncbi:MAG TPA: alkaline phosphatase family protein [Candidatus Acidoferrales bacterium]|nr:alkaline phosphatase family protein [Candidatus Acidoferrales bacterium]
MRKCSRLSYLGVTAAAVLMLAATSAGAQRSGAVLPNGWVLSVPAEAPTETGTLPQGAAASPDGNTLAVVEAGYNPPSLRLYHLPELLLTATFKLKDAYGRPLWLDPSHVLIAGASADALFDVDVADRTVRTVAMPARSYPVSVAADGSTIAVATDGDTAVRIGTLGGVARAKPIPIGGHVGGLAFSNDGTLFASNASSDDVVAVDGQTLAARRFRTGLHPTALLVAGNDLYVAESDAGTVGEYDASTGRRLAEAYVGNLAAGMHLDGTSPNALARKGSDVLASLGASNAVAVIANGAVAARIPTGWYPTDVVPIGSRIYVVDGKGEGTHPNPYFAPFAKGDRGYVATLQTGSLRAYGGDAATADGYSYGALGSAAFPGDPVVHQGGPIRHVFFILKENRTYDQVLGDVPAGNGDAQLAWFGAKVTPNQHALAARYGLFDNTYASGEVSESGHYWADAAFVNDYVERTWPSVYANRDTVDDHLSNIGTALSRNGYIWQAARAAGVTFRNYGEMANVPDALGPGVATGKSFGGMSDPHYVGWNLDYSDLDREREWQRDFLDLVRRHAVPQLEYVWLPNDHTYGSRAGKLTPIAYAAQNDYALGRMIETISHSPIWASSAIFVTEDDAQDGPDHVSDQRTTCFVVSPYSRGGLQHAHYSTVSILRTMEILLGLKPLSEYDATAVPMYAAFSQAARLQPFEAIAPKVSLTARNRATAYAAGLSARLDFTRPDAIDGRTMVRILSHNRGE